MNTRLKLLKKNHTTLTIGLLLPVLFIAMAGWTTFAQTDVFSVETNEGQNSTPATSGDTYSSKDDPPEYHLPMNLGIGGDEPFNRCGREDLSHMEPYDRVPAEKVGHPIILNKIPFDAVYTRCVIDSCNPNTYVICQRAPDYQGYRPPFKLRAEEEKDNSPNSWQEAKPAYDSDYSKPHKGRTSENHPPSRLKPNQPKSSPKETPKKVPPKKGTITDQINGSKEGIIQLPTGQGTFDCVHVRLLNSHKDKEFIMGPIIHDTNVYFFTDVAGVVHRSPQGDYFEITGAQDRVLYRNPQTGQQEGGSHQFPLNTYMVRLTTQAVRCK